MKVGILNAQIPFVQGGAEYLAESLAARIRGRGHQVDLIRIPFAWNPERIVLDQIDICERFDRMLGDPHMVIALKFPVYLVPFDNKKVWLLHQFRQVYDLWDSEFGWCDNTENRQIRSRIMAADTQALGGAKALFSNSATVARRLKSGNNLDVDAILRPPLQNPEIYGPGEYGDYFFFPSRINAIKRQIMAIEAMRHVRAPVRLVIGGLPDTPQYGEYLRWLVEIYGLQDRIRFLGWVEEDEKARWMRNALAAIYIPYDEDSYGYVTLEAFHSHKAVLTFSDSGGTTELVEEGCNGLILPPSPEALAEGMTRLWENRAHAAAMGAAAHASLAAHHIGWEHILDRLLEE